MTNIYENVIAEFNNRNCQLLTTKEEHYEISKNSWHISKKDFDELIII